MITKIILCPLFILLTVVTGNVHGQAWTSGDKPGDLIYIGGNVGIGTTNPGAKLHIAGGDVFLDGGGYNFALSGADDVIASFRGGTTTDGIFVIKRFGTDHTILQINSPPVSFGANEATLSLVRGDEPNLELVDYYNNGYHSETQFYTLIGRELLTHEVLTKIS